MSGLSVTDCIDGCPNKPTVEQLLRRNDELQRGVLELNRLLQDERAQRSVLQEERDGLEKLGMALNAKVNEQKQVIAVASSSRLGNQQSAASNTEMQNGLKSLEAEVARLRQVNASWEASYWKIKAETESVQNQSQKNTMHMGLAMLQHMEQAHQQHSLREHLTNQNCLQMVTAVTRDHVADMKALTLGAIEKNSETADKAMLLQARQQSNAELALVSTASHQNSTWADLANRQGAQNFMLMGGALQALQGQSAASGNLLLNLNAQQNAAYQHSQNLMAAQSFDNNRCQMGTTNAWIDSTGRQNALSTHTLGNAFLDNNRCHLGTTNALIDSSSRQNALFTQALGNVATAGIGAATSLARLAVENAGDTITNTDMSVKNTHTQANHTNTANVDNSSTNHTSLAVKLW